MTKNRYFYFVLAVIFLLSAIVYDFSFSRKTNIGTYAEQITNLLHKQEGEVNAFFDDKIFIQRQLEDKTNDDLLLKEKDFNRLKTLSEKNYSISIHLNDSLVFWTNNRILPTKSDLQGIGAERLYQFKQLKNGYYVQIGQSYRDNNLGEYTINAFIPIKYKFDLESNYLLNSFQADKDIPEQVEIVESGDYPIVSNSGKTLFYLGNTSEIVETKSLLITLALYITAFFFMILFFHKTARQYINNGQLLQGTAFFITSIFGLRLLTYAVGFSHWFEHFALFNRNFDTVLSASLGDLLINIILLFWVMSFFHSDVPVRSYDHFKPRTKYIVTTINYIAIFGAVFLLTAVFMTLVFNTSLDFDFNNIFDLNTSSLLAVTGIILLLATMFLFSHRMMMTIQKIGLSRNQRLLGLGIALLFTLPFLAYIDFVISPVYLLVLALTFILIFDMFIDNNVANFTWLLIWLVMLSAFPSVLLFRYNAYKDNLVRRAYAKELTDTKDLIVEESLKTLRENVLSESGLSNNIEKVSGKIDANKLKKEVDQIFINDTYLFYNYTYNILGFDQEKNPAINDQKVEWQSMDFKLETADPTNSKYIKYWSNEKGKSSYLMNFDLADKDDPSKSTFFVMEIQRQRREQSKVYTELLKDKPYKNLEKLNKYDYAVYKNNQKIDYEGKVYGNYLSLTNLPQEGEFREETVGNRSELIYSAPDNVVVVIGKQAEAHLKKAISLFSFIFSILLLFVLLFTFVNYFINVLPDSVNFFMSRKPTLRNKIQFSVIGMIVVSFLSIGIVTVWFFNNSSNEYHEGRLGRKTESVKVGALNDISLMLRNSDTLFLPSDENLAKLDIVNSLSKTHRLDVNMYNLNGQLISSSEEDIFDKGIISKQMPAPAFKALSTLGHTSYTQDKEMMGNLSYKSAYIPLSVKDKTVAFLGLPYYTQTNTLRSDVTVFMGTLINVYVFLLLIAGALTIFVANSITGPIAAIGNKLKQLTLGSRNQRLDWKSQDEIGVLVSEYNKMIRKLEESADALAQSEREGAWREMAKQVAHEIKNPLTPMKLSIQYLQHAFKSKPDNIEPLLKRVSNTLIEQIDNLAHIASEFSNFAKMPRAENQNINFNQLVLSVYDLFHDGDGYDIDISLHLPAESYIVYADKNHMIRVLTNLLKNAQQAIPEDRDGKIEVSLYKKADVVTLKVSDNGTGISNDKKDKVFVPNFTTKSSGTGLGLAISKNIIESVEGEIYFQTIVGEGTDFYVELPIIEVMKAEKAETVISE